MITDLGRPHDACVHVGFWLQETGSVTGTGGRVDRVSCLLYQELHRRRVPDSRSCSHHHAPGISVCHQTLSPSAPRGIRRMQSVNLWPVCLAQIHQVCRRFLQTHLVSRLLESRSELDRVLPNPDSMTQGPTAETPLASQRHLQPRISPLTPSRSPQMLQVAQDCKGCGPIKKIEILSALQLF